MLNSLKLIIRLPCELWRIVAELSENLNKEIGNKKRMRTHKKEPVRNGNYTYLAGEIP